MQEDTPVRFGYRAVRLETYGHPSIIEMEIDAYSDRNDSGAHMYRDSGRQSLVVNVPTVLMLT